MLKPLVRALFDRLVGLYYPTISLVGAERIPADVPVLAVLNHPNGLLDPLVLRLAVRRPVRFLGKSTLFGNPLGRLAMESFGGLPVYRQRDVGSGGGDTSKNEQTFARCREALARGEWIALFPEGTSHSDPVMKPLKTGAARIALSAVEEQPGAAGLVVLPMGLFYAEKAVFRSEALVGVGEPLAVAPMLEAYRSDERAAVDALTDEIKRGLDRVVLQAETRDLLEGVARLAGIVAADASTKGDIATRYQSAQRLLEAYAHFKEREPERVERVTEAARRYIALLESHGVRDPWSLQRAVTPLDAVMAVAKLAAMAPLALVGALLGWVPYRLAGRLARSVADAEDVLGTVKLLAGALLVLVFWVAEAALLGWRLGWPWALGVAVLGPLGGYLALRFEESVRRVRDALHHLSLRRSRPELSREVAEGRKALVEEITAALLDKERS